MIKQTRVFKKITHSLLARGSTPDPDLIHKLRVNTRRLRASFWVLDHDYKRCPESDSTLREIKHLGRVLGERRQFDVAFEIANEYRVNANYLKSRWELAGQNALKILSLNGQNITTRLENICHTLNLTPPRVKNSHDHLKHKLKLWRSHASYKKDDFHKLRIFVKKLNYIFEARNLEAHKKLKKFQDLLGNLHDLVVIEELVKTTFSVKRDIKKYRYKILNTQDEVFKLLSKQLRHSS